MRPSLSWRRTERESRRQVRLGEESVTGSRNIAVGFYGVKKTFAKGKDRLTVVDKLTLQTEENELTCIVGPSGCGKSTLLNLAAGLSPIDAGRVEFRGRQVTSVNKEVGYITQDSNLLPWYTVLENIELPLN